VPTRLSIALTLAFCLQSGMAQSDLWQHVGTHSSAARQPHRFTPPPSQQKSIVRLLKARVSLDGWCDSADDDAWLNDLSYETIPVSPRARVLLVEAGRGCARGGQGSNGAMWLIRFDGTHPTLLASPQQRFNGWLYSVEPTTGNGYRDIVLGWHMSAFEADLSYFRFDGKSYRNISSATFRDDEDGTERIIPGPRTPPR
jgi:hypothetical protein